MSAAAVTNAASKPFWIARYARAIARCVFPRPGLPKRMSERPSVTKSGDKNEPMVVSRRVDWKVKSNSSMVLRNGNFAACVARRRRVPLRCATSSSIRTRRKVSYPSCSCSARATRSRQMRRALARCNRFKPGSSEGAEASVTMHPLAGARGQRLAERARVGRARALLAPRPAGAAAAVRAIVARADARRRRR